VFENREEVTGERRRLRNEELQNLYATPSIIRVIKLRRIRWVGHVAHMGVMRNPYNILSENLKGRDHSEDPGVYGTMLEWILGK